MQGSFFCAFIYLLPASLTPLGRVSKSIYFLHGFAADNAR